MASPFTDGLAIGYITSDIQKRTFPLSLNESNTNKPDYYNFTRDTSFQTFPIDNSPQCIPEKHFIVPTSLTLAEKIIIQFIYLIIISPTLCICYCSDEKERKELCGVYVGTFIRNMLDDY
tara:strand:- start:115 stop:474 length:360 start_codon:yes stop_codon:yes gene_type:complete